MSLHQPGGGILETHVTWQDVESDIQKTLGTKATFGGNKKAIDIGDMKGFMSKIACIEPDWQNVENGKTLPEKFALKICSQLAFVAYAKMMNFEGGEGYDEGKMAGFAITSRQFHHREVEAYRMLRKFDHLDIPFTKVYSLKNFDSDDDLKGYMILEFVQNAHTVEIFRSIPVETLLPIVKGIATFSALSLSLTPEEASFAMGPDSLQPLFEHFLTDEEVSKKLNELKPQFDEEHHETIEKLIEVLMFYKSKVRNYSKIEETLRFKLVLIHGDLWQSNVIFNKTNDGKLELKALIDWQCVSRMPPGCDLSRLLLGCLSGEDRRQRGVEVMKFYHETFTKVHGQEVFTLQELHDSYNLYAPLMAIILLPDRLSFIEKSKLSEDEKIEARRMTKINMMAIMEDILGIHKYNLEHFSDFLKV